MGGRGTSSGQSSQNTRTRTVRASVGGSGGTAPASVQQPAAQSAQPPQAVPPAPTPTLPPAPMQTSLQQLTQMSDSQLTNVLKTAENAKLPNHLTDKYDPTQNLIYTIGLNAPPQIMDATQFRQFMKANNIPSSQIMSREVGGGKYRTTSGMKRNLTPQQGAQMWLADPYNYSGGKHGGQAIGAGAYFDMNGGKATGYAGGGVKMTGILNPQTARVVDTSTLRRQAQAWAANHPKADAQIQRMAGRSQASFGNATLSLYAAVLGYNVIKQSGGSYYNVIDRSAMIIKQ